MNLLERLVEKTKDKTHPQGVCLAFLGDSVTQGCFEIYKDETGRILPVTEATSAYAQLLFHRLCARYPDTPFHIINAGRSGDRAPGALKRLQRDVLSFHPDLTVVCLGLNDCDDRADSVDTYCAALKEIFTALHEGGSEVIFMTPNTMSFYVSEVLTDPDIIAVAARKTALQTSGCFDRHIEAAIALCRNMGVRVCDCYAQWQAMQRAGTDVTALLSNAINHPTRELHALFADALMKTLLQGDD